MIATLLNPVKRGRRARKHKAGKPCISRIICRKGRIPLKKLQRRYCGAKAKARVHHRARRHYTKRAKLFPLGSFGPAYMPKRKSAPSSVASGVVQEAAAVIPGGSLGSFGPAIARNPGIMSGFDPNILMKAGAVAGGMVLTNYVTAKVVNLVPVSFLQTKPGNFLSELVMAGVLGAGVRYIAPGYGGAIFLGGVLDAIKRAADSYIAPILGGALSGIGDYLTVGNAMSAKPLAGLADYLTFSDAGKAKSLNDCPLCSSDPFPSLDPSNDPFLSDGNEQIFDSVVASEA